MCWCALFSTVILACGSISFAVPLTLDEVFADHMVLQHGVPHPVWGTATPGAGIRLHFAGQHTDTTVGSNGNWSATLPPLAPSSQARSLMVTDAGSEQEYRINDVLVGEVWLCSGQSNMRWTMRESNSAERARRASDPQLRLLNRTPLHAAGPRPVSEEILERWQANEHHRGTWAVNSPESAPDFSAVAWHFGHMLRQHLDVPVGLICDAVGGTTTESYIRRESLAAHPEFKALLEDWFDNEHCHIFCRRRARAQLGTTADQADRPRHPFEPGALWASSTSRYVRFPLKGVLWYQGESNAPVAGDEWHYDPAQQQGLFQLLMQDWRRGFDQAELPFLFVQLPSLNRDWASYRQLQLAAAQADPHSHMAVTIDTGHPTNVHPKDKKPVGERLARLALAKVYQRPGLVASGPLATRARLDASGIVVEFDHSGTGLKARGDVALKGFELRRADGTWTDVPTRIFNDTLRIAPPEGFHPTAVRYAWAPIPDGNLINRESLPASPFLLEIK